MYMVDTNVLMNAILLACLGVAVVLFLVTVFAAWRGRRGRGTSYLYMLTSIFGVFAMVVVVLGFRGKASGERPWHFLLDMKYQAKYTPQGQSKYYADGRSSRLPPTNTIPFDGTDYKADAGAHDLPNPDFLRADPRYYTGIANPGQKTAGEGGTPAKPVWDKDGKLTGEGYYVNHIPPLAVEKAGGWEPLLKRGQARFNTNCAVCHGTSGRGGGGELAYGIVAAYGLSVPPPNILSARVPAYQSYPDGQFFDVITNGVRSMPAYGHQVKDPLDRWAIVAYIRELQYAYGNDELDKK